MALSSTEEDGRVYHNARVLIALRKCLKELKLFYETINSKFIPLVPNEPHPRYFPYPTSFTAGNGTTIDFRYLRSLEDHPTSITYLAEITNQNDAMPPATGDLVKVVVKFVASYGAEVHKFLADKGWAPTLRYYGPLAGPLPDGFAGPARNAPPGLRLHPNPMHMVVMDYIDFQAKRPANAHSQIQEVLSELHTNGYVFGDLRWPNILFDAGGKVKFIDFNWCGRYNMKNCNENLADGRQKQIENMGRVQVGDGDYAYYPLGMSQVEGMWASGMSPLMPILPEHDREMFKKLSWS
jgi:hypothetical protein